MKTFAILITLICSVNAFAATKNSARMPVRQNLEATASEYKTVDSSIRTLEIEPNFGMAMISPSDLNTLIRDGNDTLQKQGVKSFNVSEIGSVATFGFAAAYHVVPEFAMGLGFNRLAASSEGSAKIQENNLNGKYSMAASLLTLETRVIFAQSSNGRFEGLVSPFAGIGFYSGSTEFSGSALTNGSTEVNASAKGPVFGSNIGGRFWFTQNLAFGLNAGYRYAKSGNLKIDSQRNTEQAVGSFSENNGKKIQIDSSSVMMGAQLSWSI